MIMAMAIMVSPMSTGTLTPVLIATAAAILLVVAAVLLVVVLR